MTPASAWIVEARRSALDQAVADPPAVDDVLRVLGIEFAAQPGGVASSVRVRPAGARNPQTSRISSSLLNTRVGSEARTRSRVNSFFARWTSRSPTMTLRRDGSISSSPTRIGPSWRLWPRRRTAVIRARSSS